VLRLLHPLQARCRSHRGNVHLLRPYDEGVFYRSRTIQGLVVVGDIQLYLDLYSDPARGRERAQRLREKEICF